jgi:uncharacterized Zn finger protein (UPF0148 family)
MLTSQCPSCGAPIEFRHAASVAAVCPACTSTVLRSDESLTAVGKVSSMARDLSPIQIGVMGTSGSRGFSVAGVLRKAREGVRWNEWFLVFDDGDTGWLSDGNGEMQVYSAPAASISVPDYKLGQRLELGGKKWIVSEKSAAKVIAAEGELPFAVVQDQSFPYGDLRAAEGQGVATIDHADEPPSFWEGEAVSIGSLKMEGLRAFAGWADDAELSFQGPEIEAVRSLECPGCGAPVQLRAHGDVVSVGCAYCGATMAAGEGEAGSVLEIVEQAAEIEGIFELELGNRIQMEGRPWEIIGAMRRQVEEDGEVYPWDEYFLRNPYAGYRWLVRTGSDGEAAQGWTWVGRLPGVPKRKGTDMLHGEKEFASFYRGRATVAKVVGEFTWQVKRGAEATTHDFIAPPHMLSMEKEGGDEISWSIGEWKSADEIRSALGGDAPEDAATIWSDGITPARPNPWSDAKYIKQGIGLLISLAILYVGAFVATIAMPAQEQLLTQTFKNAPETSLESETFVSNGFKLPAVSRRAMEISYNLDSTGTGQYSMMNVAMMNLTDGNVHLLPPIYASSAGSSFTLSGTAPGDYVARVEFARKKDAAPSQLTGKITVTRDPVNASGWLCFFPFFLFIGPVLYLIFRQSFESQRWKESNV